MSKEILLRMEPIFRDFQGFKMFQSVVQDFFNRLVLEIPSTELTKTSSKAPLKGDMLGASPPSTSFK